MHHISEEDLALYSIQALTPGENLAVQEHLNECAICRAALSEALGDAALVCLSVDQQAMPEGAKQRLLERIVKTSQDAAPAARAVPESVGIASLPATVAPFPVRAERRSGLGWVGWAVAAAAIAAAAYLGSGNMKLQQQLNEDRSQITTLAAQAARAQDLTDALTSPAAKQVTLTEAKQPSVPVGHATYLPKRGALVFIASNLRPLGANKTYELWLIPADGKAPMPAGLFRPNVNGSASVVLPPLPEGVEAKAFGVTIEDAQGSSTPTLPIVMAGQ